MADRTIKHYRNEALCHIHTDVCISSSLTFSPLFSLNTGLHCIKENRKQGYACFNWNLKQCVLISANTASHPFFALTYFNLKSFEKNVTEHVEGITSCSLKGLHVRLLWYFSDGVQLFLRVVFDMILCLKGALLKGVILQHKYLWLWLEAFDVFLCMKLLDLINVMNCYFYPRTKKNKTTFVLSEQQNMPNMLWRWFPATL